MKLENIMRVEILNLNFSIKDRVISVSKTQKKNCLTSIYIELHGAKLHSKCRIHKNCR